MRRFILIFVVCILAMYVLAAFISADMFWLDGIMSTWTRGDRAFLLWWVIVALWITFGITHWVKPKKSDPK